MRVSLIVAIDAERGIGKDNDLMWHLPADMRFFKTTTTDQVVVMGRKNWDSIPEKYRPLANRQNVVLTRNANLKLEGAIVFTSLQSCLEHFKNDTRTIFIIGGGEIYKMALQEDVIDEMYITKVNHIYGADTFFPEVDTSSWKEELILQHDMDEKHNASFTIYKYSKTKL